MRLVFALFALLFAAPAFAGDHLSPAATIQMAAIRTFNPLAPPSVGTGGHASGPIGGVGVNAATSTQAAQLLVYPGCTTPSSTPAHTWYVDINASTNGNGLSPSTPFNSLSQIFCCSEPVDVSPGPLLSTVAWQHHGSSGLTFDNSAAPIKPGDLIIIAGGDYGALTIQSNSTYGGSLVNSDFVTLRGATGQTVIIDVLTSTANKMWFDNITFRSPSGASSAAGSAIVKLTGSDQILSNSVVQTVADASTWTIDQWTNTIANVGVAVSGNCDTVRDNTINFVLNAGTINGSSNTLFTRNHVRYWGYDAFDVVGSNYVEISDNVAVDHIAAVNYAAGNHSDFTQIMSTTSNYVTIKRNYVNQITTATLFNPSSALGWWNVLQCVDDYAIAGSTDTPPFSVTPSPVGIVVTDNICILNDNAGVDIGSNGAVVTGNTMVGNSGQTWVALEGTGSLMANNIADIIDPALKTGTGNISYNNLGGSVVIDPDGTRHDARYVSGLFGNNNYLSPDGFARVFNNYNPTSYIFDVRLLTTGSNPAIGTGISLTTTNFPGFTFPSLQYDLTGTPRTAPPSLGAYNPGTSAPYPIY